MQNFTLVLQTFTWLPYTSKVAVSKITRCCLHLPKRQKSDVARLSISISISQSFAHRIWEASQPHSNYQNIMSVDAEIRNLSDSIPASCKIDPNSPTMEHEEPWKVSQKVALSLWLNSSLLQLHRRYYASGYQRPEYAFSTSACLSSARHIIQLLQTKVGKSTKEAVGVRWSRFWLPDRIFSAASVLLIQLLQPSVSGNEAASLMRDVDRSIDFIQSFVVSVLSFFSRSWLSRSFTDDAFFHSSISLPGFGRVRPEELSNVCGSAISTSCSHPTSIQRHYSNPGLHDVPITHQAT